MKSTKILSTKSTKSTKVLSTKMYYCYEPGTNLKQIQHYILNKSLCALDNMF